MRYFHTIPTVSNIRRDDNSRLSASVATRCGATFCYLFGYQVSLESPQYCEIIGRLSTSDQDLDDSSATWLNPSESRILFEFKLWFYKMSDHKSPIFVASNLNDGRSHAFVDHAMNNGIFADPKGALLSGS